MKIRRYIAADMRSALKQVRDSLGEDAVILSSRRTGDSVEVVAAIDTAEAAVASGGAATRNSAPPSHMSQPAHAEAAATQPGDSIALATEVKQMRRLLESQLATLAWNEFNNRSPLRAALLRELAQLGMSHDVAAGIVAKVPDNLELGRAMQLALGLVASDIKVSGDRWLETGGTVAFVGPTGAGKTTVISKLAARWVLRHGSRGVALISADSQRFGAHEQIHMLGRLLGVTAHTIHAVAELPELLAALRGCCLVLIDTAGTSPRDDSAVAALARVARECSDLEYAVVVSANAQAGAVEQTFARYQALAPSACILTKLDEASSLGGTLSALIRCGLPVAYCSEGPRVPEDLAPARAHALALIAQRLARKSGATVDEDLLQHRFGAASRARA